LTILVPSLMRRTAVDKLSNQRFLSAFGISYPRALRSRE
jgi:hypothetical protein